jgi:hypothetical protein
VCRNFYLDPLAKIKFLRFFNPMNPQESALINELFDRIAQTAGGRRDQEAEQLIASKVAANPHAPYVLAQSTIILQQAVAAAQTKIAALEKQVAESGNQGGSFLSGMSNLFGTPQSAPARPVAPPPIPAQAAPAPTAQGGGFLQNAMATAAGVAGGALLFQGIENLMGHGGGYGGSLGTQPTEVVNNYYEGNDPSQSSGYDVANNDSTGFDNSDGGDFGGGFGGDDV